MSRIEQVIGEIEEFIGGCKKVPMSSSMIFVNRDELEELVHELKLKTPDEIKKYQKLISNKEAIIADAKAQADQMIREAQIHTAELVNEHEIMQRAYEQANAAIAEASRQAQAIVDQATEESNHIRMSAIQYTDDMLANLQMILQHSIESNRGKYEALLNSLDKDLNIVVSNRRELRPSETPAEGELVADMIDDDGPTDEE